MKHLLLKLKTLCLHSICILRLNKLMNNLIYSRKFSVRVNKLAGQTIFDYYELAMPTVRYYTDYVPENNDKNMGRCLKEYMKVDVSLSLNAMIEHGLFLGNYVADREYILQVPSIITFGDQRIMHLKAKGIKKNIIPIGPYIHYAYPLMKTEEFAKLKRKLGKVLLVFPSHSLDSEGSKSIYNINEFKDEIDRIGKDFDTILVSLHYSDINLAKDYEDRGYKCVTSGHSNDPFFMHRQRSIIELADVTISNSVGTHIGYCIYLKKPHYIFKQHTKYSRDTAYQKLVDRWRDVNIYNKEVDEIENAFGYYSTEITKKQYDVANKYWGFKYIKSPEELKSLLTFSKL